MIFIERIPIKHNEELTLSKLYPSYYFAATQHVKHKGLEILELYYLEMNFGKKSKPCLPLSIEEC